ncbi:hypothetical protein ACWGJ2_40175 [Streptomyces sp. NPDC054796]
MAEHRQDSNGQYGGDHSSPGDPGNPIPESDDDPDDSDGDDDGTE